MYQRGDKELNVKTNEIKYYKVYVAVAAAVAVHMTHNAIDETDDKNELKHTELRITQKGNIPIPKRRTHTHKRDNVGRGKEERPNSY